MFYKNYLYKEHNMKFIDLFAGLGGFHKALSELGMECVFASEIDRDLQSIYQKNHGIKPKGDVRLINEDEIPNHDVLCAEFPCQPFSIAGKRKGAKCPSSGKLIDDVIRIAKKHQPDYVFLENVPNILTIDSGKFWSYIQSSLNDIGYKVNHKIYSPVDFDIPQNRKRVFVIAQKNSIHKSINWPNSSKSHTSIESFFKNVKSIDIKPVENRKQEALHLWQEVVNYIGDMSSHSIVASEFGSTYLLDNLHKLTLKEIRQYKGSWGQSLSSCKSWNEVFDLLPHYIDRQSKKPSNWLLKSIIHTRSLYQQHGDFFDSKKEQFKLFPQSWHKLDWQGYRDAKKIDLWQHIIQFRASGIRIIKPKKIPSLIAMTPTQIPIIGQKKRYLTIQEAASLQGLNGLNYFPENSTRAFKALGNAVNSHIVKEIALNNFYR